MTVNQNIISITHYECDAAFKQLKKALTEAPVLAFPEGEGEFVVDTDASDVGIGCILSQLQNGEERVIAYYSRTLRNPERNHCVTRKELLAVIAAIGQFHHYLYGHRFWVRSDHASLQWLMRFKNPQGQTARWLQRMEYDFEVVYRAGKNHGCRNLVLAQAVDTAYAMKNEKMKPTQQSAPSSDWPYSGEWLCSFTVP